MPTATACLTIIGYSESRITSKAMRASCRRTVLVRAKVMSYDDIVAAENEQQVKRNGTGRGKGRGKGKKRCDEQTRAEKEIDAAQIEVQQWVCYVSE